MSSIDVFSLPRIAAPKAGQSYCVYVLFSGDEVVYVGQSVIPHARINSHVTSGKKFDSYSIINADDEYSMNRIEFDLIVEHDPKYNNSAGNASLCGMISINLAKKLNKSNDIRLIRKAAKAHGVQPKIYRGLEFYPENELINAMKSESML